MRGMKPRTRMCRRERAHRCCARFCPYRTSSGILMVFFSRTASPSVLSFENCLNVRNRRCFHSPAKKAKRIMLDGGPKENVYNASWPPSTQTVCALLLVALLRECVGMCVCVLCPQAKAGGGGLTLNAHTDLFKIISNSTKPKRKANYM